MRLRRKSRRSSLPTGSALLQFLSPPVTEIPLGTRVGDRVPLSLPISCFKRNVALIGATGQGKTGLLQEAGFSYPFEHHAVISLDYIGAGSSWAQNYVATFGTVLQMLEAVLPDRLEGVASDFMRQYAFATISHQESSPVRINVLRRRQRPDGSTETVAEVVDRFLEVFNLRFPESSGLRVRFRRVARALLATLVAGNRFVTEARDVLTNAVFRGFVSSEIRRLGADADEFVREQQAELERICQLKARPFEEMTESTMNSFADYGKGTVLGNFFGSPETFNLELAAFRGYRLYVTSDLPNERLRAEAFLALHGINRGLFSARRPGTGTFPPLDYVIDEITWAPDLNPQLSTGRNLGVSTFLAFQSLAQFSQMGQPHMEDILPDVCRLRGIWRPSSMARAKEIAYAAKAFDPMGMTYRESLESITTSDSVTDSISDSWSTTISQAQSFSRGTSLSEGLHGETPTSSEGESSSDGGQFGESRLSGGGSGRSTARAVARAVSETFIRIPCEEQALMHAQSLLQQREHRATFLYEGKAVEVDVYPPRQFPTSLLGLPTTTWYREFHRNLWESQAEPSVPFRPVLRLGSADGAAPVLRTVAVCDARSERVATSSVATPCAPSGPEETAPSPAELSVDPLTGGDAPRRFDPKAMGTKTGALDAAAQLRVLSVHDLMVLTGCSYDKAARTLEGLASATPPLLDRIRPAAAQGEGSAPFLYVLTSQGARVLVDERGCDEEALRRLVRNVGARRRDIEQGVPTQVRHQQRIAGFLARYSAAVQQVDPAAVLSDLRLERDFIVSLAKTDLPTVSADTWWRLQADPSKTTVNFIPDFALRLRWGSGVEELVLGEIETGFGQTDYAFTGFVKAAKIQAVARQLAATGSIGSRTYPTGTRLTALVWVENDKVEVPFHEGARRASGEEQSPLWITNGEKLPLSLPRGIKKVGLPDVVRSSVRRFFDPVWRWVRLKEPTDRRRLLFPPRPA